MKTYIKEINNTVASVFFSKDPLLCAMGLADQFLKDMDDGLGYNPPDAALTGFFNKDNDELIGFIQATLFTESTILVHGFLHTKYHHSGIFRQIANKYVKYIHKYYPTIEKLMVISPEICTHVHNAILGLGFKKEGCLTKSMIWRNQLRDVFIFGRCLLTNNNLERR